MKKLFLIIAIFAVATLLTPPFLSRAEKSQAKHEAKFRKAKKPKHGEYIVVLQKETPDSEIEEIANNLALSHGGSVMEVFRHAIKGFGVRMPEGKAKALAKDPRVLMVEENAQSEPVEEPESMVYGYEPYGGSAELEPEAAQSGAPWSLDRIDQRDNPYLDGVYRHNRTGQGVDAYIIDSGILLSHDEFGGRAIGGFDWDPNNPIGRDCHGHGTHVAGLVGGRTYGSAKNVRLYAVRIADCGGGSNAYTALSGVNWAIANYEAQNPRRPAVMNISYAFSYNDYYAGSLDYAVNNAISRGITVVIAAGNFGWFSGYYTSPQGSGFGVINVAMTDINDTRPYWSDFGELVDLFAPGVSVPSAGISSNTAIVNMSGTSMASPLTAGVAAMYLEAFPTASPATVSAAIVNNATNNKVIDPDPWGGAYTVNKLLYSFFVPPPPHIFVFSSSSQTVNEGVGAITITVNRSGLDLPAVTVDYATSDGPAQQKGDYCIALGKLSFAAGQTSKTFQIFITDDGYVESNESFSVRLSNPTGGASLGVPNQATITIVSNDSSNTQPIDNSAFFMRQQYIDFLNREPDSEGLQFYLNILNGCDPSDIECIKYTRGALSANFFRSPEFGQRGGYVANLFNIVFGQRPKSVAELSDPTKVERPHYLEFMADLGSLSAPTDAETNVKKDQLAVAWLGRPEVQVILPNSLSNQQFVQKLESIAGVTLANESTLIANLNNASQTRAQVLRAVAESSEVTAKFYIQNFITMEYIGYLRREPENCHGSADPDNCGYIFHYNRFNTPGADPDLIENIIARGFIESPEYRQRFGP